MAHNNTILSQLLKLVSRHEFESLTKIQHYNMKVARFEQPLVGRSLWR